MARLVEVEHHSADGTETTRRMRESDWEKLSMEIPALDPGEFYVVYGDLKKRWDGCRRMTLKGFLCRNGYRVELQNRNGVPVPVVQPDDE